MKIKNVSIQNFKKISSAQITFNDGITKVSGKNGAGKSSIYDAIWTALLGKSYVGKGTSAEKLITTGETKAEITVRLHSLDKTVVVRRKINEAGDMYLEAVDGDANKLSQKEIDALCSLYAVDPLEFTRLSAKAQYELVQKATGLDTTEVDQEYELAYNKRSEANAVFKNAKTQLDAMGEVRMVEKVNTQELSAELQKSNAHNQSIADDENRVSRGKETISQIDIDIQALEAQKAEIQVRIELKLEKKKEYSEIVSGLESELKTKEKIDAQPILDKLAEADTINSQAEKWTKYAEMKGQVQVAETKAIKLDDEVKAIQEKKKAMIQGANMPLENMEINEKDGVIVNGLPFTNYSTAEQIIMACKIATATNPEIKLIGIKDGSLLDDDTLEKLEAFAQECNYQFYLERVGEEVDGLIIRDGDIVVDYVK